MFDEAAAKSVMAEYEAHGIDIPLDYDHAMLGTDRAVDPAQAGKAAGWFNLEVRDGELWAVNVRWTEPAAEALRRKEWRFMSPAFQTDEKGHILSLLNVAITNLPATRQLTPLMAASRDRRALSAGPAFSDVQTALNAALAAKFPSADPMACTGPWVVDVFDATMIYQLDGKLFEVPYSFDGSAATLGAPAEVVRSYEPIAAAAPAAPVANNRRTAKLAVGGDDSMTPEQIKKALDVLTAEDGDAALALIKDLIAGGAGEEPDAEDPTTDPAALADPAADDPAKEDKNAVAAAVSSLTRLTGKTTLSAAVEEVETWRTSHIKLEAETAKLAKDREALELAQRKENAVKLTALGAETPHTTGLAKGKLCKRLLDESLNDQNERVAALLAARGGKLPTALTPPASGDATDADGSKEFQTPDGPVTLSASELSECQRAGAKPEVYAANKAKRVNPRGKK